MIFVALSLFFPSSICQSLLSQRWSRLLIRGVSLDKYGYTDQSAASTPITNRPTFTSSPSLKPVTSTFTSTMADGGVVVVTTTSYVDPDPVKTTGPTSKRPTPTLQNAAPARQNQAQGALFGLVVGAALLI